MSVMSVADWEHHLVLLDRGLGVSLIEYALAILTLSNMQIGSGGRLQNEIMGIILKSYLNVLKTQRVKQAFQPGKTTGSYRVRVYFRISADIQHTLHRKIRRYRKPA